MRCAFCGIDFTFQRLVRVFTPDGQRQVDACYPCAIGLRVWCGIHHKPYIGVAPEGVVCMACVRDDVRLKEGLAHGYYQRIVSGLPGGERKRLEKWIDEMRDCAEGPSRVFVLWALVMEAHRRQMTTEAVAKEVIEKGSADALLPCCFCLT